MAEPARLESKEHMSKQERCVTIGNDNAHQLSKKGAKVGTAAFADIFARSDRSEAPHLCGNKFVGFS